MVLLKKNKTPFFGKCLFFAISLVSLKQNIERTDIKKQWFRDLRHKMNYKLMKHFRQQNK